MSVMEIAMKELGDLIAAAASPQSAIDALKAETVTAVNAVTGHGADPTGATDTIAQLSAAATAAAGKTLFIPTGDYQVGSTLIIPDNTIVMAYGARIFNTSSAFTLLKLSSGAKVYGLEIEGSGNGTANTSGIGIDVSGTDSSNYTDGAVIEDCYFHAISGYGIYGEFIKNIDISRCKISNIGYAGIGILSGTNVKAKGNRISDITPGISSQAYGVFFSRRTNETSLILFPRSKDCDAVGNTIENITIWEALDTHGGENISFINNTIRNCSFGISIGSATDASTNPVYGPIECQAIGNRIYGLGTAYGIAVSGNATEKAQRCLVQANTIFQGGLAGNNLTGGIYATNTIDLVVNGNILKDCYCNGIHIYSENKGFSVTGNTIRDVQDATYTQPSCIGFRSGNNEGIVSGNSMYRDNASLNTYVSVAGINMSTTTGMDVRIGNNFNNCTNHYLGTNGQHVKYGEFGANAFLFSAAASPESVISASPGSLCINISGGAGTTFFVKQSGTGNTGWVGK